VTKRPFNPRKQYRLAHTRPHSGSQGRKALQCGNSPDGGIDDSEDDSREEYCLNGSSSILERTYDGSASPSGTAEVSGRTAILDRDNLGNQ
jgi:hypothetical protein